MNTWIRPNKPLVIAHRGNSQVAPENTITAFESAIQVGADMLEVDVNISRDGKLVIIHDHILGRTVKKSGEVSDYDFTDLIKMDAGSYFHVDFKAACIPSCEETILLAKNSGIPVCFEIKGNNTSTANVIAEKLMQLFSEFDVLENVIISSYYPESIEQARHINPLIKVARERLPDNSPFNLDEAIKQAQSHNASVLLSDYKTITTVDIDGLHAAGIALWAWNPVLEEDILDVISMGCDGIMGDNPKSSRKLVEKVKIILSNQVKQEDALVKRICYQSSGSFN